MAETEYDTRKQKNKKGQVKGSKRNVVIWDMLILVKTMAFLKACSDREMGGGGGGRFGDGTIKKR